MLLLKRRRGQRDEKAGTCCLGNLGKRDKKGEWVRWEEGGALTMEYFQDKGRRRVRENDDMLLPPACFFYHYHYGFLLCIIQINSSSLLKNKNNNKILFGPSGSGGRVKE